MGGRGAARECRSARKSQHVTKWPQGAGGPLKIAPVAAVGVVAVNEDRLFLAQLRPARAAMKTTPRIGSSTVLINRGGEPNAFPPAAQRASGKLASAHGSARPRRNRKAITLRGGEEG